MVPITFSKNFFRFKEKIDLRSKIRHYFAVGCARLTGESKHENDTGNPGQVIK